MRTLIYLFLIASCSVPHNPPPWNNNPSTPPSNENNGPTLPRMEETVSDVVYLNVGMKNTFDDLPLKGNVETKGRFWSGDYWPNFKGSINFRWNSPGQEGFNLDSPNQAQVAAMSSDQLAQLAPTEKFAILNGDYTYSLRNEVAKRANNHAAEWEGICDGWAPASMNHKEPSPKFETNPDGIKIPFGSSDIKAILSYYYAAHDETNTYQIGKRCSQPDPGLVENDICANDVDAGVFHIVLTNMLGRYEMSFLADLERYIEVWNYPIMAYDSSVEDTVIQGNQKLITLRTVLYYVDESTINTWDKVIGTNDQIMSQREFRYTLRVDASGRVLDGSWLSKMRPDFLWTKPRATSFTGNFAKLQNLLND